jgi:hypothetical protein
MSPETSSSRRLLVMAVIAEFYSRNLAGEVTKGLQQKAAAGGTVTQYEDSYRLCYVRGPEGIIVALAEQLS